MKAEDGKVSFFCWSDVLARYTALGTKKNFPHKNTKEEGEEAPLVSSSPSLPNRHLRRFSGYKMAE